MRKSSINEIWVPRREAVQELLHIVSVEAKNLCGANAGGFYRVVKKSIKRKLIISIAGFCKLIERIEDNSVIFKSGLVAGKGFNLPPLLGNCSEVQLCTEGKFA